MMRGEEKTRHNTLERRLRNDHMWSVTGMQKLCKTPTREVHHNQKILKIQNLPLLIAGRWGCKGRPVIWGTW